MRANDFHDWSFTMFSALGMMSENGMSESGRKESNCVRCRNHGLKIVLRGHKQYCPYAVCTCDKCRFTAEQQRQMRLQNAIRRQESTDRTPGRRQRNSTIAANNSMVSPQPQQQTIQHIQAPQQQQIILTTISNAQPDQRNGGSPHGKNRVLSSSLLRQKPVCLFNFFFYQFKKNHATTEEKKMLFDCSSELLKKFRYPWEMMPIMYALAKYANGNIEDILQKIDEGRYIMAQAKVRRSLAIAL